MQNRRPVLPQVFPFLPIYRASHSSFISTPITSHSGQPPRSRDLPVTPTELGLSMRQGEILALVLQGLPNKRIALQYDLSESTVKEHMSAILLRLGARTRVEAITRLRGRRLVLPSMGEL